MALTSDLNKVWHRYESKQKDGTIIKLRFQDLPPSRNDEAIDFKISYMLSDEAFHIGAGIYKNKEAIEEYRNIMTMLSGDDHVTMCCIDDETVNGGKIVGLSTVGLKKNTDSINDLTNLFPVASCTKEIQNLFNIIRELETVTDLSKRFNCYYHGYGIIVHPGYRGMGIANEFVRLRGVMCHEHNIPMSSAWMTAKGTQRAAEKNNWKTDIVITPEDLGKRCGLTFAENTVDFSLMYKTKD